MSGSPPESEQGNPRFPPYDGFPPSRQLKCIPQPSKSSLPLVTVVMPVHNSAAHLRQTLEGLGLQTFADWDCVAVDDGSEDDSITLLQEMADRDKRLRLKVLDTNVGAAVARNKGIREARGRFIAFLDSDDVWHPEKLERQLRFMRETKCHFSFTAMERVNENGQVIGSVGVPRRVSREDMLKTNYIGCSTAMYDTAYFGKVEMPLIRRRQDYALWLKLLRQVRYAHGLNQPLTRYRVRAGSVSSNKLDTSRYTWQVYRQIEGLSFFESVHCYAHQTVRALLRNRLPRFARWLGLLHRVEGSV